MIATDDAALVHPEILVMQVFSAWGAVFADPPEPDLFAQVLVAAFEHAGYPLTCLHDGAVELTPAS